jgi:CheY-like chemotaxis protein
MEDTNYIILLVEDEENDATLLQRAFRKNDIPNSIHWVKDGMQALAYLRGEGEYADRSRFPFPSVIMLDLKMPRMGGLEFLKWIRDNPDYQVIPTIVMSSSQEDPDIQKAYALGANTYMLKPPDFDRLMKMVKTTHDYWTMSLKPRTKWSKPS